MAVEVGAYIVGLAVDAGFWKTSQTPTKKNVITKYSPMQSPAGNKAYMGYMEETSDMELGKRLTYLIDCILNSNCGLV